jgi:hypothetical protein
MAERWGAATEGEVPMGNPQKGYRIEVRPFQHVFVRCIGHKWICDCRDYLFAAKQYEFSCVHIEAVRQMLAVQYRKEVA